jgi:hypothetical protein
VFSPLWRAVMIASSFESFAASSVSFRQACKILRST